MDNLNKRGRKASANPKKNRLMIRLNSEEHKQFLKKYERSGMKSYSAFIADCVLNNKLDIVEINKSAIDFVISLSENFAQIRAIKNNFNQMYNSLVKNFGEEKALEMIQILAKSTCKLGVLRDELENIYAKLRERCLQK